MRESFEVAKITFQQLARDRIFQLGVVFFFVVLAANFLFSELTLAERGRVYVNFGLSLIHFVSVAISIVLAVLSVRREIDSKSLMTIFVRPISRDKYMLGLFLGLAAVMTFLVLLFSLILHLVFLLGMSGQFYFLYYLAVLGILAEVYFALALSLFLAVSVDYPTAIASGFAVIALGHWMSSFRFFLNKASNPTFQITGEFIYWIFPHLERVDFKYWPIVPDLFDPHAVSWGLAQIFAYTAMMLLLSFLVMRRKDVG